MAVGQASFVVQGIESEEDVATIEGELESDAILEVVISSETGEANIKYDVDLLAEERIKIMIEELGYEID
jgi:copper chaperone CopZ